jgi:polysaccharide export outer membrane protein
MRSHIQKFGLAVLTLGFWSFAAQARKPALPEGAAAYQAFPPANPDGALPPYKIGAFDKIAVSVFQEEDLSVKDVQVDSGGNILLPLIGQVKAAGRTSTELADSISGRLGSKYLVNPQVSVVVEESVSQKVTVEGSVIEPGVYAIQGRTTLLDAVAMAKGTSRVAALDEVAVFRDIGGKRVGALFNLKRIGRGEAQDPQILGNDTVVIGLSNVKAAWRDLLTATPLIAAARPF